MVIRAARMPEAQINAVTNSGRESARGPRMERRTAVQSVRYMMCLIWKRRAIPPFRRDLAGSTVVRASKNFTPSGGGISVGMFVSGDDSSSRTASPGLRLREAIGLGGNEIGV